MKRCEKCQLEYPDEKKFCRKCGGTLVTLNTSDTEFCPSCGKAVVPGKKFCRSCGALVNSDRPMNLQSEAEPKAYQPTAISGRYSSAPVEGFSGAPESATSVPADLMPRPSPSNAAVLSAGMQQEVLHSAGSMPPGIKPAPPETVPSPPSEAPTSKSAVVITVSILVCVLIGAALYFFFRTPAIERRFHAALNKGNLVAPVNQCAYDLYLQIKNENPTGRLSGRFRKTASSAVKSASDTLFQQWHDEAKLLQVKTWDEAFRLQEWLYDLESSNENKARLNYCQAQVALQNGQYQEAIGKFKEALTNLPHWSLAINGLGRAHVNTKDYSIAEDYYRQAIGAEPNWVYPHLNLGGLLLQQKRLYDAQTEYLRAVELAPQKPFAHFSLAVLFESLRDNGSACRHYQTAIQLAQGNAEPGFSKERVLQRLQKCNIQGNPTVPVQVSYPPPSVLLEAQKRTMADMRAIGTAIESYAVDHNIYPDSRDIYGLADLLQPRYIHQLPAIDGWNNPFTYIRSSTGQEYWIISFGSDGRSDNVYQSNGVLYSTSMGATRNFTDDIVFSQGLFVRYPEGSQK